MSSTDVQPVQVTFAGTQCEVVRSTYPAGGANALLLLDAKDGVPVTTATINVAGHSEFLDENTAVLKSYSENEGLLEALEEARIVEDTGSRVATGFVESPVVRVLRQIPDYR